MATAGPNYPGTYVDDSAVGTKVWASPVNASSVGSGYAQWYSLSAGTFQSHYLKLTNFGFAISAGATIDGVTVEVSRYGKTSPNISTDTVVSLVKGGTVSGDNKADTGTAYPNTMTTVSYGGISDLWGLSLSDSDVNSSTFGFVLSNTGVYSTGFCDTRVDFVRITITYTAGAAGLKIPVAMQSYRQRRV